MRGDTLHELLDREFLFTKGLCPLVRWAWGSKHMHVRSITPTTTTTTTLGYTFKSSTLIHTHTRPKISEKQRVSSFSALYSLDTPN